MSEREWQQKHHEMGGCMATYGKNLPCQLNADHESAMHTNRSCGVDWYDDERAQTGVTHEEGVALLQPEPALSEQGAVTAGKVGTSVDGPGSHGGGPEGVEADHE